MGCTFGGSQSHSRLRRRIWIPLDNWAQSTKNSWRSYGFWNSPSYCKLLAKHDGSTYWAINGYAKGRNEVEKFHCWCGSWLHCNPFGFPNHHLRFEKCNSKLFREKPLVYFQYLRWQFIFRLISHLTLGIFRMNYCKSKISSFSERNLSGFTARKVVTSEKTQIYDKSCNFRNIRR